MSKGFVNVSIRYNGNIGYYLREKECTYILSSENLSSSSEKEELKNQWLEIEKIEKLGSKDLGIRGRYDAVVYRSYILSMPNQLTAEECANRVKNIIEKTVIKDCTWTIAVHRGEKEGITNQHVHLLVNERNIKTLKKDREIIKKSFLNDFKKIYQQEFKEEFSVGKEVSPRGRIETNLFWTNSDLAREIIAQQQQSHISEKNRQIREVWQRQVKFAEDEEIALNTQNIQEQQNLKKKNRIKI